jgi:hypothetical protein
MGVRPVARSRRDDDGEHGLHRTVVGGCLLLPLLLVGRRAAGFSLPAGPGIRPVFFPGFFPGPRVIASGPIFFFPDLSPGIRPGRIRHTAPVPKAARIVADAPRDLNANSTSSGCSGDCDPGGLQGPVQIAVSMGQGHESRLEGRGGEIDPLVEHVAEEAHETS